MISQIENAITVVIMGVCGSGKTTLGRTLSEQIGAVFIESDELHPQANITKMSNGTALTDADRWPWLEIVRQRCSDEMQSGHTTVVACSALRRSYRDILRGVGGPILFVYLNGETDIFEKRMSGRSGNFMPREIVASQFATLESPQGENDVLEIDFNLDLKQQCVAVKHRLGVFRINFRSKCRIGLVGLGVMGSNLAANLFSKGYRLQAFDIDPALRRNFSDEFPDSEPCHHSLETLVAETVAPRCLMLLIKAGPAVDQVLEQLLQLLEPNDMIVDLGNSYYKDTDRRCLKAAVRGIRYVGCGISGGAEGARLGPALMPGGDNGAVNVLQGLFTDIAAKYEGVPCVSWIGPQGSGHFVKMVHNGIEYADMQLIAETYQVMRDGLGMGAEEISEVFDRWNTGPLASFLIEATATILKSKDTDGTPLVDRILDKAGQNGSGSWISETALEFSVPASLITEAVFARMVSSMRPTRQYYAGWLGQPERREGASVSQMLDQLEQGLYAAKIIGYVQGFMLMAEVSKERIWNLNPGKIARIWRAGCIIRGRLLNNIVEACDQGFEFSLLDAPVVAGALIESHEAMRNVVKFSINQGIPVPSFSSAVSFFDSIRTENLPGNLIQAQRDYFGAHTFERTDQPEGGFFHADWHKPIKE